MKFKIVEMVASAYLFNVFIVLLHALDGYVFASFNTFVGEDSGHFNDGNENTGVGKASLYSNLTGVNKISAGTYYSLALLNNGKVTGWGYNSDGQATGGNNLTGVTAISAGRLHSLALLKSPSMSAYQVFVSWS